MRNIFIHSLFFLKWFSKLMKMAPLMQLFLLFSICPCFVPTEVKFLTFQEWFKILCWLDDSMPWCNSTLLIWICGSLLIYSMEKKKKRRNENIYNRMGQIVLFIMFILVTKFIIWGSMFGLLHYILILND